MRFSILFVLMLFMSMPAFSVANDEPLPPRPEALLALLSDALRNQNYTGEFTYEHGSKLESFRVYHSIGASGERENLYKLTGREQSFVRNGSLACGTIGGYLLSGSRLTSDDGQYFGLDRYYKSVLLGRDRIAGRYVWVVQLAPVDEHRFGITLAIDEVSHLLMRYVIYDPLKKIALERMQFVSLDVGEVQFPESDLEQPPISIASQRCVGETYTPDGHSPWKPGWLPPGFILTGYNYSDEDGHMETYTDGVSSFSVFVQTLGSTPGYSEPHFQQGFSVKGAFMALISTFPFESEALNVSIVGEIPLPSAQKISLSLHKVRREQGEN